MSNSEWRIQFGFLTFTAVVLFGVTVAIGGGNSGTDCWNPGEPETGADIITGEILPIANYASVGEMEAYAVGFAACNIGSQDLLWVDNTPQVPVTGQNMFRLKDDRFEQIGQAWVFYNFTALTENICGCGCNHPGGTMLGVGCSHSECCALAGAQNGLGPKFPVNAYTGAHPSNQPPWGGGSNIERRLQVKISDLNPAMDGGGLYFVEAQHVTPDDAADGNQNNNASYRQINIATPTWSASLAPGSSTQRGKPGIRAWKDNDPEVIESDVQIPGEGLMILSAKATDLGDGFWHYEYALQNLNSDRSAGSFSVPVGLGTVVQNIGFHDVDYHSGEPFEGTDWTGSHEPYAVIWSTTPYDENPDANALRWGTLYNFRFDANIPSAGTDVSIGLFKPGMPTSVTASTVGPSRASVPTLSTLGAIVLSGVLLMTGALIFRQRAPRAGLE